jgi:putative redox protein
MQPGRAGMLCPFDPPQHPHLPLSCEDFLSISDNRYIMSAEIAWPESRKEWKPVDMTVTYNGSGMFTASTSSGITYPMEAPVGMGGQGILPNPIQYLVGSLGGCIGVKILLALSDNGIVPDELTIGIHGTRKKTMPAFFDHVHLAVTLRADADDALVSAIIEQTLTRLCPIAAMFAEVGEVTAEHRIIRNGSG